MAQQQANKISDFLYGTRGPIADDKNFRHVLSTHCELMEEHPDYYVDITGQIRHKQNKHRVNAYTNWHE